MRPTGTTITSKEIAKVRIKTNNYSNITFRDFIFFYTDEIICITLTVIAICSVFLCIL